MRKFVLLLFFFLSVMMNAWAQFEHSFIFLNLKRNIPGNFANVEWELGNDEMNFLKFHSGINISGYENVRFCPYFTNTLDVPSTYQFSLYESKKFGLNNGIGYVHYFKYVENEKTFIPYCGGDINWYRVKDDFTLQYTDEISATIHKSEKENIIHTFSASLNFGFLYTSDKLFFKISLISEFFLPVNTNFYMPSDDYNTRSSRKLPFNGFEPGAEISLGFKLF